MSDGFNGSAARYTSFFLPTSAGEAIVRGTPQGSAGYTGVASRVLASLEGIFAIGQDAQRLLSPSREPFVRRLMPARPATQANVPGALVFADAE